MGLGGNEAGRLAKAKADLEKADDEEHREKRIVAYEKPP